jgi:hypothetical protein
MRSALLDFAVLWKEEIGHINILWTLKSCNSASAKRPNQAVKQSQALN